MRNKSVVIILLFLLVLVGAFLALAARCFYLQYYKNSYYDAICLAQKRARLPQKPQRGVILDCRGRVLAASNKIQVVFADPVMVKDPKAVSSRLQPILCMGAHEICRLITEAKNPRYVKIKEGVEPNQCDAARRISGVGVDTEWKRHYPMGRLAANVVGFTSLDHRGLGGVELQYDAELSGTPGQRLFFADIRRRPIRPAPISNCRELLNLSGYKCRDGCGIILTLDATIQQFAREELLRQYRSYEAESAVAIVAEPQTGAILALVSLPDFDPENFWTEDPNHFRNRAITDEFEPGSIVKPIVAAVALDAGVVNTHEKIFCENGSYAGKGFGRIGEYRNGFGDLTLREILVNSSNIGMAKIGQRLGKNRLYEGLKLFGFGKKTGIDLPGEADGLLRPTNTWTGYSVTRIPFGQEITVTVMQLVRSFCILANGGRLVQPYLVRAVVDNNGEIVKLKRPPPAVGYVVSRQVAKWIVTEAMVGVVNEGTGKRAKLDGWQLFGKTGTANIAKSDGKGYSQQDYVASFVAGAPAQDPAIVVLVSIRKPNKKLGKGYTGGVVASPVAAKIVKKTLTYLRIPRRDTMFVKTR